jgi:hypothetical protein
MNLYQPTITGSLSVSGSVNISGSITIAGGGTISGTASYATNAELLDGLDSTVFTLTSSFAAQTASFTAFTSSILSYTASQNILNGTYTLTSSFAAQTASFTAFTASILAQTASLNSFSASVLSYTSSLNAKTSSFATTGSNTFEGIQTVNSNLVVTGSITAQTLVVQTITSSVDFVTGSTRFGSILGNTHVFSGSVTMNPNGLFVSSSGLVGIGTITPTVNLLQKYLSITDNYNVGIILNDTRAGSAFEIYNAGADFYINYGTTNRLRIIGSTGTATFSNTETTFNYNPQSGSLLSGYNYLNFGGGSIMYRNTTDLYIGSNAKYGSAGTLIANYTSANGMGLLTMDGGTLNWQATTGSVTANTTYGVPIRFTITSAGNVGIGTNSPNDLLEIKSTTANQANVRLYNTFNDGSNAYGISWFRNYDSATNSQACFINYIREGGSGGYMSFGTGTVGSITSRMVISSGGNVGIGTNTPLGRFDVYRAAGLSGTAAIVISSGESPSRNWSFGTDVVEAGDFAICVSTTTGGTPTPTGTNVKLRILSDGTLLIGGASSSGAYNCSLGNATANTYYQVRSTNTNSLYGSDTRGTWMGNLSSKEAYINCSSFVPGVDNSTSCGSSSYRWTAVYAVNGTIQTSDQRQKTNIFTSDLGLDFINKLNPVSYKWKVGGNDVEYSSVEDENIKLTPTSVATPKAGVRTHYGLIAQQVKEVLGDKDFGGFVHDEETDTMSLRYDQFISPLIKAIQELKAEFDAYKTTHP